jgi:type IV pilus assembly protein PilY1
MNTARRITKGALARRSALVLAGTALLSAALGVAAQTTDISTAPLVTASPTVVKPNLMFVLDDSGSMNSDFMPDQANFHSGKYGRYAAQCNGLAFNPNGRYPLPLNADGTAKPPGTYTFPTPADLPNTRSVDSGVPVKATGTITVRLNSLNDGDWSIGEVATLYSDSDRSNWMQGVVTAIDAGNNLLTVNFTVVAGTGTLATPRIGHGDHRPFYYTYSGAETALDYKYSSSGVDTSSNFYRECDSLVGSTPGNGRFTRVDVTTPVSQNYMNWHTYYRTRMLTMRSAVSRAFVGITDNYRVGFSTIGSTSVNGTEFLDVADFDATQKATWYSRLFNSDPGGYTPLRGAVSKAGQYFAKRGKLDSGAAQSYDPVQYSCQKNFAILTTDGYWNTGFRQSNGTYDPGSEIPGVYGPYGLDGNNVGQQDGTAPRPMYDGGTATMQTRTSTLQSRGVTPQWRTDTTLLQRRTITPSWRTDTSRLQTRTAQLQTRSTNNGNSGSPNWTAWSDTTSCTWDTSGNTRRQCQYVWSGWTNATSTCTRNYGTSAANGAIWGGPGADCQYSVPVATTTASCTAVAPSAGPTYTVATAVACTNQTSYGAWTNAASCSASATEGCQYGPAVSTTTNSCTPAAQSTGPNYTVGVARACTALAPVYSAWADAASCTASSTSECRYTAWTAFANTASCTAVAQSTAPNYTVAMARECQSTTSSGSSDSLADVAMYYYKTDLRNASWNNCTSSNGVDVCRNNVNPAGSGKPETQHLSLFTLGLGVNGMLKYHPNYLGGQSPDYQGLINGTVNWPTPGDFKGAENIDDLWHAAVNAGGQYFSAGDPDTLATSLAATLAAIDAKNGTASAAATSSLEPIQGDSVEYVTSYTTVEWSGDVKAYQVDPKTGLRAATADWSARTVLDNRVTAGTARNIFYMRRNAGANTGTLQAFTFANLQTDGLGTLFENACSKAPALTQCTSTGYDIAGANSGANLVDYLRGVADARYRARTHVLGDTVGGGPVFVKRPPFKYTENGYQSFVQAQASRPGVVYVPANDGMLHAFDEATGQEKWAFVPSMVMNKMYRLADKGYATKHEYFVNATPVVNDVYVSGTGWRTILVGGLGAGGRGYYALDITDPNNPSALWEFSNDALGGSNNLGLTFGNPVVTKRTNGQWVVAFTSGYNNVSPGNGNGRLFVVNAMTGQLLTQVPTLISAGVPAGTTTTPSGLAKINAWVDSPLDNTAKRFYGGDLLGNVWRFDIDGQVQPNNAALRLAELRTGPTTPQPITTRPELSEVKQGTATHAVVYVATGQLLGLGDISSTGQQTIYAIKDPLTNTPQGDVRSNSNMVVQTLTPSADDTNRTISENAVNWTTNIGWRVDLPTSGERVNIDMRIVIDALVVASNRPTGDACSNGARSYLYQLDLSSGSKPPGVNPGVALGDSYAVGLSVTKQYDGDGTIIGVQMGDGGKRREAGGSTVSAPTAGRRASWRELAN